MVFTVDETDDLGTSKLVRIETAGFSSRVVAVQTLVFSPDDDRRFIIFLSWSHLAVGADEGRISLQALPHNSSSLRCVEISSQQIGYLPVLGLIIMVGLR